MDRVTRGYEKRARAQHEQATRLRIVEAAIELHQELGPDRTSMADVAGRAGIGRATVYRHFQDLDELGWACSGLYFERHPLPDYEPWRAVPGGPARLQVALRDAYAYHRSTEPMMTRILGLYRDDEALLPYYAHWKAATDLVVAGYEHGGRLRRAAVGHALSFDCWRSLVRDHGLSDEEAVAVAGGNVI